MAWHIVHCEIPSWNYLIASLFLYFGDQLNEDQLNAESAGIFLSSTLLIFVVGSTWMTWWFVFRRYEIWCSIEVRPDQTDRTGPSCMQIAPLLMFQSHMHYSTQSNSKQLILAECTDVLVQLSRCPTITMTWLAWNLIKEIIYYSM